MSIASINAAKKRRTEIAASPMFKNNNNNAPMHNRQVSPNNTPQNVQSQPIDPKKPMQLQQVITLLDNRILYLENHLVEMSNTQASVIIDNNNNNNNDDEKQKQHTVNEQLSQQEIKQTVDETISEHVTEFDHRYELLAQEFVEMKQIVLSLQSYTMDVNKTLLADREQLLKIIE